MTAPAVIPAQAGIQTPVAARFHYLIRSPARIPWS